MFILNEVYSVLIISVFLSFIFCRKLLEGKFKEGFMETFRIFLIVIPFVFLHELSHKVVGSFFGIDVLFGPSYFFLFIGLLMSLFNWGFFFFIQSYLEFEVTTYLSSALIGFAGPFINLVLALVFFLFKKKIPRFERLWSDCFKVNLFLFAFNLLPLPGFDGSYILNIVYF